MIVEAMILEWMTWLRALKIKGFYVKGFFRFLAPKYILMLATAKLLILSFLLMLFFSFQNRSLDDWQSSFLGKEKEKEECLTLPPFSLLDHSFSIPVNAEKIAAEIECIVETYFPGDELRTKKLEMALVGSGQKRKVAHLERLGLGYNEQGHLIFSMDSSAFWMDVSWGKMGVDSCIHIVDPSGEQTDQSYNIYLPMKKKEISSFEQLPADSILRQLTGAYWIGKDLVYAKYGLGAEKYERIAIPHQDRIFYYECNPESVLASCAGQWEKKALGEVFHGYPILRIESIELDRLILEAWDDQGYYRLAISKSEKGSMQIKGEDLFHSVRLRSKKQISCLLEKQALILQLGDWVCKEKGRWRLLRKKEDREKFYAGQIVGELFIFDKIITKQSKQFLQGSFFNKERSAVLSIEAPILSNGMHQRTRALS